MAEKKYLDQEGLNVIAKHVKARLKAVMEMPSAAKDESCVYMGESSSEYIKGHIYQAVAGEGDTFIWKDVTPLPEAPIVVRGTVAFADLPTLDKVEVGEMYNISDDFVTTDNFVNVGATEKAGSNVYCIEVTDDQGNKAKKWDVFAMFVTDQQYNSESENAQSGVAVAQAIANRLHAAKVMPGFAPQGEVVAYIGGNTGEFTMGHLYRSSTAATSTEWANSNIEKGSKISSGQYIWSDGENSYYSNGANQFVFDRDNNKWIEMHWKGLSDFSALQVWTDGEIIYCSPTATNANTTGSKETYILNKEAHEWGNSFSISTSYFYPPNVWTDGEDTYFSSVNYSSTSYSVHYKWNKGSKQWTSIPEWTNKASISGSYVGSYIWTDGETAYLSNGSTQAMLNKEKMTWTNMPILTGHSILGSRVWTDGENIYWSSGATTTSSNTKYQAKFDKVNKKWVTYDGQWRGVDNLTGDYIWVDHGTVYYLNGSLDLKLPLESSWIDLTKEAAPIESISTEDIEEAFK